ncbi:SPFH domain-containing protein [Frateuria aurantia]
MIKRNAWLAVAVTGLVSGCTVVTPGAGQQAVLIDQPYFFGHGGVRTQAVPTGRTITWGSTNAVYVDMTPQTVHVSFNDYSSADNILLDFDTAIQYRVKDPVVLIRDFGNDWFKNNVASQYSAIVREAVKTKTMTDMMSNVSAAAELDRQVTAQIRALIQTNGLPIQVLDVTLGRAVPNANVLEQMNETAAQQQRLRTLDAAKLAEDARKAEQESKAAADDAYREKMGMSVDGYLQLQIAQIQADACKSAKSCIMAPPGSSVMTGGKL